MAITKDMAEVISDIFYNTENLESVTIELDSITRNVVILIEHLDCEWFNELEGEI